VAVQAAAQPEAMEKQREEGTENNMNSIKEIYSKRILLLVRL
jgi:hypothetical protein